MRIPLAVLLLSAFGPPAARTAAPVADDFAQLALEQLPAVRDSMPLGRWIATHPEDRVVPFTVESKTSADTSQGWCADAFGTVKLSNGDSVQVQAMFFPPEYRPGLPLPRDVPARELLERCQLRMVLLELRVRDSAGQRIAGEAIYQALKTSLGRNALFEVPWLNTETTDDASKGADSSMRSLASWTIGAVTLTATNQSPGVAALLRTRTLDDQRLWSLQPGNPSEPREENPDATSKRRFDQIEELLPLTGMPAGPTRTFREWTARWRAGPDVDPTGSLSSRRRMFESTATFLLDWVRQARSRPAGQQAAALLAADHLLSPEPTGWSPEDAAPLRQRLAASGMHYQWHHLGEMYFSDNGWLQQAAALQPAGRTGDLAFMAQVERVFSYGDICQSTGFDQILLHGEPYLARHPGSSIDIELHLMLARANADLIQVSAGGGYYDDSLQVIQWAKQAPEARRLATEHYRYVVEHGTGRQVREAWTEGWRMLAGLPSLKLHFYCFYD